MSSHGWIGVDFDGTLATHDESTAFPAAGQPIWPMIDRVRHWIRAGVEVRIVTARAAEVHRAPMDRATAIEPVERFCEAYFGRVLPVTAEKDFGMVQLWDDRAVTVEANTGRILTVGQ